MQAQPKQKIIDQQIINLNRISSKPTSGHCGYCDKYQSYSWGMTTKEQLHPYTYQLLAERGWRRCGFYYYKPDIKQSCCKLWTHRMDVNKFRIKKDQRKTVRTIVQWMKDRNNTNKNMKMEQKKQIKKQQKMKQQHKNTKQQKSKQNKPGQQKIIIQISQKWTKIVHQCAQHLTKTIQNNKRQFFSLFQANLISQQKQHYQFQYSFDINKIKCFKSQQNAKSDFYCNYIMLLFGANKGVFKKQYNCLQFVKDITKFIQDKINQRMKQVVIVEVQRSGYLLFTQFESQKMLKRKKSQSEIKKVTEEKILGQKQTEGKKEKKIKINQQKMKNQTKEHHKKHQQPADKKQQNPYYPLIIQSQKITFGPMTILVVPAQVTDQSWKMYQKYSTDIHEKAQKSKSGYSGFLCQKALKYINSTNSKPCQKQYLPSWQSEYPNHHPSQKISGTRKKLMGCYHMKYYIDKQFIGVGVVDFFPDGLSSVYFFYQPKYKDQRLGVFSSLIEIQYIRWLSLSFPQYKNYYMGFYIQNCVKMQYKGNYQPFDLLCPITYQFVECNAQMRQLIDKIQKRQIQSIQLAKDNKKIEDMNFQTDIGVFISQKVKIKYQGQKLTLKDLNPKILIPVLSMLKDMVQVWGKFLFETFTFTF